MPVTLSSLGAKTRRCITLTSGTSWTVPAGVTYVNVTLVGGGGGGGGGGDTGARGGTGGTTTFTGATSALGGAGGSALSRDTAATGPAANNNSGIGGSGSFRNGTEARGYGESGRPGDILISNVSTTPGASISYAIVAGGTGGTGGSAGGTGGSGRIEIEYWA